MKVVLMALTNLILLRCSFAFSPLSSSRSERSSQSVVLRSAATEDLGLTPELEKITNAFEAVGDDKLRHKQLLYMAGQLAPMDKGSMIPENKVVGCLSTVYVDGKIVGENGEIEFTGDSDGLLTKGLVALLVRGLSGSTAEAIQKVDPKFIEKAGIQSSLTPGRNNGFLNMLSTMKRKASELQAEASAGASTDSQEEEGAAEGEASESSGEGGPMYNGIISALQALKPATLELTDVSYKHEGHAGMNGVQANESHFELNIVADAFDGLNLVKRHQLVYMLLGDIMPKIHALQITAKTPDEMN